MSLVGGWVAGGAGLGEGEGMSCAMQAVVKSFVCFLAHAHAPAPAT